MHPHLAHVFVDGGYLRRMCWDFGIYYADPRGLATTLVDHGENQTWAHSPSVATNTLLGRITYYDAVPDSSSQTHSTNQKCQDLEPYWQAIELLRDVRLGFGKLRGTGRSLRQKGVDTLMAVDMLVGAFSGLFDVAVLVSGDADFVPVVEEVKRRGVMVAVAAATRSLSDELRRAADRFIEITQQEHRRFLSPIPMANLDCKGSDQRR